MVLRMHKFFHSFALSLTVFVVVSAIGHPLGARDGQWVEAYKVRSRLLAGHTVNGVANAPVAFVQIEMAPGWKTYWRHPGEAGGIPPEFSWQGSTNVASADVLYPAPMRLKDPIGDTVGYKDGVMFPVRLKAADPAKPIGLKLTLRFGICKEICVPSEANLSVEVPPLASQSLLPDAMRALQSVPRAQADLLPKDPMLQAVHAPKKNGDSWVVGFTTKHAQAAKEADLFLEAPPGLFVPLPKRTNDASGKLTAFQITLSDSEYRSLQGQTLRATVVDPEGASHSEFVLR